jgi:phosphohistidine swiveling domain-containing protein
MATNRTPGQKVIVKGVGASPGIAHGPVKILHNIQEIHVLQSNDVLVLPTASPDLIVAIKKAAAVVTDAGGLTSHAAIICRHFNIPCVVGTRNATKILQNDLFVKVDGDKGVVSGRVEGPMKNPFREPKRIDETLHFFGQRVTSVSLPMNRIRPLWAPHWHYAWPDIDQTVPYQWVPYRPEMYVEPIADFLLSAIEKGPNVLNLSSGPLYARFHNCNIYLRLDKLQTTLAVLRMKLETGNTEFVNDVKNKVEKAYRDLDIVTQQIQRECVQISQVSSDRLLQMFHHWWSVCDDFFALNVLIAAMSVDIIWPRIRTLLREVYDSVQVNQCLSLLARPSSELISIQFYEDCSRQLNASVHIKALILSNLTAQQTLEIIQALDEGKPWLVSLQQFIQKWGWMRDRLLYFEPISQELAMIKFMKQHFSPKVTDSPTEKSSDEFQQCINNIRLQLSPPRFEELIFHVEFGRFLQTARDNRFLAMMRNTDIIRKIFLELGRRLREEHILYDERDIFFLLINEVFELFALDTRERRRTQITNKISNRMIALTYVSKLLLHERPGYSLDKTPKHDFEFY